MKQCKTSIFLKVRYLLLRTDVGKNMTFVNPGKFRFFLQVSKNVFIRPKPLMKIALNSKLRRLLYIFQSLLKHQHSSNLLRLEGLFQSVRRRSDTEKHLLHDPCIFLSKNLQSFAFHCGFQGLKVVQHQFANWRENRNRPWIFWIFLSETIQYPLFCIKKEMFRAKPLSN